MEIASVLGGIIQASPLRLPRRDICMHFEDTASITPCILDLFDEFFIVAKVGDSDKNVLTDIGLGKC